MHTSFVRALQQPVLGSSSHRIVCRVESPRYYARQLLQRYSSRKHDPSSNSSRVCRRRVLELGSGSIKCQVSDVDVERQTIVKNITTSNAAVLFTRDLTIQKTGGMGQPTAAFSPAIQREGIVAIQKILLETDIYRPDQTMGVATEAFRKAANGPAFASAVESVCNLPVVVLSAEQEAKLGFQTAAAVSGVEQTKLIAWDCGAGSFQISSKRSGSHVDSHGSGTVTALAQPLRDRGMGPEIVADYLLESLTQQLAPVPAPLKDAIRKTNARVVAIGSQHSIFNQQRILSGLSFFTQQDVEQSIRLASSLDPTSLPELELQQSKLCGDTDDQDEQRCVENATFMVPKLILLLAVMRRAGIDQATFYKTNGNCGALLVQPWLWEASGLKTN